MRLIKMRFEFLYNVGWAELSRREHTFHPQTLGEMLIRKHNITRFTNEFNKHLQTPVNYTVERI